jgi:hypothetical protein
MKDKRYKAVKPCFEAGIIKKFADIFRHIPKTIVYRDVGIKYVRFSRAIHKPGNFKLDELCRMAELFEIDARTLIEFVMDEVLKKIVWK